MSTESTFPEEEIRHKYADYLQTARDIQRGSWKPLLPYLVIGLLLFSSIAWAGIQLAPWLMLLGMGVAVTGAIFVSKWIKDRVRTVNIEKPGFEGFFKLHRNYYWTKQLPSGKKFDGFLSLIGEKRNPRIDSD